MNEEEIKVKIQKEGNLDFFMFSGYPCFVMRPHVLQIRTKTPEPCTMIHLTGYVGVPKGHKLFGKEYTEISPCVHGGLTYSGHLFDGVDGKYWFFGFDCAHAGDLCHFRFMDGPLRSDETYKDMEYVSKELLNLAKWLKRRGKK